MDKFGNKQLGTVNLNQNFTMKLDKTLKEILSEIKKMNISLEIIKNKKQKTGNQSIFG